LHNEINYLAIQLIYFMVYFDQEKVLILALSGVNAGVSSCLLDRRAVFGATLRFNRRAVLADGSAVHNARLCLSALPWWGRFADAPISFFL
jgi:hypothetical protein